MLEEVNFSIIRFRNWEYKILHSTAQHCTILPKEKKGEKSKILHYTLEHWTTLPNTGQHHPKWHLGEYLECLCRGQDAWCHSQEEQPEHPHRQDLDWGHWTEQSKLRILNWKHNTEGMRLFTEDINWGYGLCALNWGYGLKVWTEVISQIIWTENTRGVACTVYTATVLPGGTTKVHHCTPLIAICWGFSVLSTS